MPNADQDADQHQQDQPAYHAGLLSWCSRSLPLLLRISAAGGWREGSRLPPRSGSAVWENLNSAVTSGLDGRRKRPVQGPRRASWLRHTSLERSGPRWASATEGCPGSTRSISAAHALRALVERTGVDAGAVEDVIMGCVSQIGPQSLDIARQAWLSAGLPEHVPGVTVDRQCGSSQQALHFAAQAVLSGTQDLVVAAGVESMSVVPMGSSIMLPLEKGMPLPFGDGLEGAVRRPGDLPVPRGAADLREVGDHPPATGGVRAGQPPAGGTCDRRGPVRAGDQRRSATSRWTRARAGTRRWRRWPGWRRCGRAGRSPRRPRPRSPTARRRCWWRPRRRCGGTG